MVHHVAMNTPVIICPAWCEHRTDGRPVTAELSRVDDLDEDGTITPGPVKVWVGLDEHPTLTGDDLASLAELLQLAGRRLADTTA